MIIFLTAVQLLSAAAATWLGLKLFPMMGNSWGFLFFAAGLAVGSVPLVWHLVNQAKSNQEE